MEKFNLGTIKHDNYLAVINCFLNHDGKLFRLDIADETDLSRMTVGKIVDNLISDNIIVQTKENKSRAGRKSGLLSLNTNKFCYAADLTGKNFILYAIEINFSLLHTNTYRYKNTLTFEDNLRLFIKSINFTQDCFGINFIVKDNVIFDETLALIKNDLIIDNVTWRSYSDAVISSVKNTGGDTVYISISKNTAATFLIINGSHYKGFSNQAGNISDMLLNGKKFSALLKQAKYKEPDNYTELIASAVYNMIQIINPGQIIINSEKSISENDINNHLDNKLHMNSSSMPKIKIYNAALKDHCAGAAEILRRQWFENKIKKFL